MATEPFVWGSGGAMLTPEEITRRRKLADAMVEKGSDYSPVQHWAQGLARVTSGILGGLERHNLDSAAQQNAQQNADMLARALSERYGAPAAQSAPTAVSIQDGPSNGAPNVAQAPTSILQAMSSPYATPQTRAVAQALMGSWDRQRQETRQDQRFATEDAWRRSEAARAQANSDRSFQLQQEQAKLGRIPSGYQPAPEGGGIQPMPGGPQDFNAAIEQRKKLAAEVGLQPGTAQFSAFVLNGKVPTDRPNIPAGYAPGPNDTLVAIPGGPAEKIDAEVASRLGLTKSFLGQLPAIKQGIENGEATGAFTGPMGALGYGRSAELRRQVRSGVDSLIRNLTGAGMSQKEAEDYASRYAVGWGDSQETALSKLQQLERELRSTAEVLGRGRGGAGFIADIPITFTSKDQSRVRPGVQGAPQLRSGAVVNGYIYRGGDPNSPQSWERSQ